ncbi:MAG: hypothetical protein ACRC57_13115 [Sarcina sp.]
MKTLKGLIKVGITIILLGVGLLVYSEVSNNSKFNKVLFESNNIFENGLDGIFLDINKNIKMPKDLYIANKFAIEFDKIGNIISFNTDLYGNDENNVLRNFIISYDGKRSKEINIELDKKIEATYDGTKPLDSLVENFNKNITPGYLSILKGEVYQAVFMRKPYSDNNDGKIQNIDSQGGIINPVPEEQEYVMKISVVR